MHTIEAIRQEQPFFHWMPLHAVKSFLRQVSQLFFIFSSYVFFWVSMLCYPAHAFAKRILLFTNPMPHNLSYLYELQQQGYLPEETIQLQGIFHRQEADNYASAYRWLEEHPEANIELQRLTCHLERDSIYQNDACLEEFTQLLQNTHGLIVHDGPELPYFLHDHQHSDVAYESYVYRHYFELSLLYHLLNNQNSTSRHPLLNNRQRFPITAVGSGMHTFNVAMGGTLGETTVQESSQHYRYHDVNHSSMPYRQKNRRLAFEQNRLAEQGTWHPIFMGISNRVSFWLTLNWMPDTITVWSSHPQAVKELGNHLEIIATSTDRKVIQGFRHKVFYHAFGFQFHPEINMIDDNFIGAKISETIRPQSKNSQKFYKMFWGSFNEMVNDKSGLF